MPSFLTSLFGMGSVNALPFMLFGLAALLVHGWSRNMRRRPLPFGPCGIPVLGNLFQIPPDNQWRVFSKWYRQWGDVIYFSILDQPMILLRSVTAVELLDKPNHSGRPIMTMAGELCNFSRATSLAQPGRGHREQRKLMHRVIGSRASIDKHFGDRIDIETRKYLAKVLEDPDNGLKHFNLISISVILNVAYGYTDVHETDYVVQINKRTGRNFSHMTVPSAYLVDTLPILKYVPSWIPGAKFQRNAKVFRKEFTEMHELPFDFVKREMAKGTAEHSFTAQCLEEAGPDAPPHTVEDIRCAAGVMFGAGQDTITATGANFFLLMTLFPSIQRRAQQELDSVVGPDRLPALSDLINLPYLHAILLEVYRWQPVVALSVPRRVLEDDVYRGFFIPKDATVIMNTWQVLHDETLYKDAITFNPGRFVGDKPERDPRDFSFGYGRRICPGRLLADAALLLLAYARILALFRLSNPDRKDPHVDADEHEVRERAKPGTGTTAFPRPFACRAAVRSGKASVLIRDHF